MLACQNGLEDVVRMLLDHNVNLEPKSPYRKTALVIAKENGRLEIAKLLEDHAAEIASILETV
jgi:ankyrin repeat protein